MKHLAPLVNDIGSAIEFQDLVVEPKEGYVLTKEVLVR
jgi:hypothetical protein